MAVLSVFSRCIVAAILLAMGPSAALASPPQSTSVDKLQRKVVVENDTLSFYSGSAVTGAPVRRIPLQVGGRSKFLSISDNSEFYVITELISQADRTEQTIVRSDGNEVARFSISGQYFGSHISDDGQVLVAPRTFMEGNPESFDFVILNARGTIVSEVSARFAPGSVYSLAASGQLLVVGGKLLGEGRSAVEGYQPHTGERLWSFELPDRRQVFSLSVSGDGTRVLAATRDPADLSKGRLLALTGSGQLSLTLDSIEGRSFFPDPIAVSPSGSKAAVVVDGRRIALIDLSAGTEIRVLSPDSLSPAMPMLVRIFDLRVREDGLLVAAGFLADRRGSLADVKAAATSRYAGCLFVFDAQGTPRRFELFAENEGSYSFSALRMVDQGRRAYSRSFTPLRILELPPIAEGSE